MRTLPPYPPSGGGDPALGGDLSGTASAATVDGINGIEIKTTAPAGAFADNMPLQVRRLAGTDYIVGSLKLPIAGGGTNAGTAADARTSLGCVATGSTTSASGTGATGAETPTFTGTAPTAAFAVLLSGTGITAVGSTVTTSDNQTAVLGQYIGCALTSSATNAIYYITASAACTGAPLVLTVCGTPANDVNTYYILGAPTPAGSVSSHTHTGPSHTHTVS